MNNTKNWLDELKVRVSYGEVGNTAISPYSTLSTLGRKPYIFGETNGINTYRPDIVANRNIAWEVSKTINFGADFSIFNQRLSGSIELYKTNTTNLIMDKKLPAITGFSRITDNIGETQNKGIELSLQGYVFRSKSLNYKIDATWSLNEEKIVDLFLHQDDINNNWFIGKPISVQI